MANTPYPLHRLKRLIRWRFSFGGERQAKKEYKWLLRHEGNVIWREDDYWYKREIVKQVELCEDFGIPREKIESVLTATMCLILQEIPDEPPGGFARQNVKKSGTTRRETNSSRKPKRRGPQPLPDYEKIYEDHRFAMSIMRDSWENVPIFKPSSPLCPSNPLSFRDLGL